MSQMEVLLARQPILDRARQVVAYELLFRSADWAPELRPEGQAGNIATSQVLLNAFEELDIAAVVGDRSAYVNFTRDLILSPPPFDKQRIVIEVLEDVEVDVRLLNKISELRSQGYTIALDDFVFRPELAPLVNLAHVIKLDTRAHTPQGLREQLALVRAARAQCAAGAPKAIGPNSSFKLLAEKVETHAEFAYCCELGFDLFQGYFFARPEQISGVRIPASRLNVLRLLAALQQPDATFEEIRDVIATDPPLSFKLIKLVNSAALGPSSTITSLQAAVALLGLDRVRSWASLLALSKLSDKSPALTLTTLVRAHLCEAVGRTAIPETTAGQCFVAGLLSTLDAYFDRELSDVIQELPVSTPIRRAVVGQSGKLGALLRACIDYERGALSEVRWWALASLGVTPKFMEEHYRTALLLANDAAALLDKRH